jgi:uncharacterized RDD family membrane protein YckC
VLPSDVVFLQRVAYGLPVGLEGQAVNPYAPPGAVDDDDSAAAAAELPTEGADFVVRAAARFADFVIHLLASLLAGVIAGTIIVLLYRAGIVPQGWQRRINGNFALNLGTGLVATTLFYVMSEGMAGATPGKYLCGLRVLLDDGRRCTTKAAFIRSLSFLVDSLVCGLVGYSAMQSSRLRQRYGDRWAHTIVVKAREVPEASQAPTGTFVVAWASALGVTIVFQILTFVLKAL